MFIFLSSFLFLSLLIFLYIFLCVYQFVHPTDLLRFKGLIVFMISWFEFVVPLRIWKWKRRFSFLSFTSMIYWSLNLQKSWWSLKDWLCLGLVKSGTKIICYRCEQSIKWLLHPSINITQSKSNRIMRNLDTLIYTKYLIQLLKTQFYWLR